MTQERLSEIWENRRTLELSVFASQKREWPRRQERERKRNSKRNRTPSASPAFRQVNMTLTIQFPIRHKSLTIALLAIVCMLIACFPILL